ncbi:DUF7114 family protein [Halospeciosus flavus]|uniref:DUF7114 family protein n=1 Tax=Halospeciosus flavus TaxID=3032283 RepID=UPI003616B537
MEEAEQARVAARDAVADVTPSALHETIDERLVASSMVPGALTVHAADAVPGDVDDDAVVRRAAGVQLIYEGLTLTRTLVGEEPWADVDLDAVGDLDADLDVLAADVFVARGFRLLARTEAATGAVEVVREFGREQTENGDGTESEEPVPETSKPPCSNSPPSRVRPRPGRRRRRRSRATSSDSLPTSTGRSPRRRGAPGDPLGGHGSGRSPPADDRARPHSASDS